MKNHAAVFMRFILLLLFIIPIFGSAQKLNVSSGAHAVDDGYDYLITNNEPVTISLRLKLDLKNLKSNKDPNQIFVIPPFTTNFKVLELRMINRDSYGYNASASYVYGDQRQAAHDLGFNYHLPYARSSSYRVSQGYNGNSTHRGKYAIDFTMPVGTPVHAARDGIVVEVKQDQSIGCTKPKCLEYANYIRILHMDGTVAEYTHLKVNGALVRSGDTVRVDQHIGYSGNTGWTTGPHLHFTVYRPQFGRRSRTIPVNFLLGPSIVANQLQENKHYRKP